jgi:hypothetical protein
MFLNELIQVLGAASLEVVEHLQLFVCINRMGDQIQMALTPSMMVLYAFFFFICLYSFVLAWSGGMHYVDGYIFPCYSCQNPEQQMIDTINSLKSAGVSLLGVNTEDKETLMKSNNGTLGSTVGMLW